MDRAYLSPGLIETLICRLNSSAGYRHNARALSCTLRLCEQDSSFQLRFDKGELSTGFGGSADLQISGSREQWRYALSLPERCGLYDAVESAGGLSLTGELLTVASNAKAFRDLWQALRLSVCGGAGV